MANDPNRDLLPVKEDCYRTGKGLNDKFDYQILGKLSRCELEDRFLRLLDEQTHIKKLANSQEEKIKRLGTKLLRLINEKKHGKKFTEQSKETEELNLKIIELEHENYTLRDKNTVLKQQLSSHSRNLLSHRSPIRSSHTSPLMTMRHSAPMPQSESAYDPGNKNEAAEIQLQEAEAHIKDLNEEIKSLHSKIDFLQQNLEKNNLDNRKIKVSENIELIRLQRSLKQQAIQIAALQEQVRNSEKSQKILKEDLIKAHNENDDALHLISVKQNEILGLCSKLEEKNLNRLEEDELRERINDLMIERDCLKERSEFLMKSIGAKAEESEKINELQKLLAEEKAKKEKLEEALETLKNSFVESASEVVETSHCEKIKTVYRAQQTTPEKKEMINFACNTFEDSESSRSQESILNPEAESDTSSSNREPNESNNGAQKIAKKKIQGKCAIEKIRLELELQYLREMLRSQTLRCEAQQAEIGRLMYELKVNEEKCSETLQRLDWHLRIFEGLEMRAHQNELFLVKNLEPSQGKTEKPEKVEKPERVEKPEIDERPERVEKPERAEKPERVEFEESYGPVHTTVNPVTVQVDREESWKRDHRESVLKNIQANEVRRNTLPEDKFPSRLLPIPSPPVGDAETKKNVEPAQNRRFIEQTFLESSDDESYSESPVEKETFQKRDDDRMPSDNQSRFSPRVGVNPNPASRKRESSYASAARNSSESSLPSERKPAERHTKRASIARRFNEEPDNVTVSILWFRIKPDSSLWKNQNVETFFFDFTFLDVNGAETETPQSLPKPRNPDKKCEFNFTQTVFVMEERLKMFEEVTRNPETALFVFKLVSDSEKYDGTNDECEDIGVAVITVKEFLGFCNRGPFHIQVKSYENHREVIGTLAVSIEASKGLLNVPQDV